MAKQTQLALFFCGVDGDFMDLPTAKAVNDWVDSILEISLLAKITPYFLADMPVGVQRWRTMLDVIKKTHRQMAGYVVLHPSSTMLATAAALTYGWRPAQCPIVFVSAQPAILGGSVAAARSNIRSNIINAMHSAQAAMAETTILQGGLLVRAIQAHAVWRDGRWHYDSPVDGVVGKVDFSLNVWPLPHAVRRKPLGKNEIFDFNTAVHHYAVRPDFNWDQVDRTAAAAVFDVSLVEWTPTIATALATLGKTMVVAVVGLHGNVPSVADTVVALPSFASSDVAMVKAMWVTGHGGTLAAQRRLMRQEIIKGSVV